MISINPEPSFPISERLATEYSEDDEETRVFRLNVMERLLMQWADCYLAIALALMCYAGYVNGVVGVGWVLVPLIGLDVKLIGTTAIRWRRNDAPEQFKAQMKTLNLLELLEHSCTLLCKLLICISLLLPKVPLVTGSIPLTFHLILRFLYHETSLNDCYAFSGMVRGM